VLLWALYLRDRGRGFESLGEAVHDNKKSRRGGMLGNAEI
jgi:hypothetical protein